MTLVAASLMVISGMPGPRAVQAQAYCGPGGTQLCDECPPTGSYVGRNACYGYFTGRYRQAPIGKDSVVFYNGLYANNLAQFLGIMSGYLNGASLQNRQGAAAIIDIMLGKIGPDFGGNRQAGIDYAMSHYGQWAALVTQYSNRGLINWNVTTTTNDAQGGRYVHTVRDPILEDTFWKSTPFNVTQVIRFSVPPGYSGKPFQIERSCGNLFGDGSPLQSLPEFDLQPSVSVDPPHVAQGLPADFQFAVNNVGQTAATNTPYRTTYTVTPGPNLGLPSGPSGTRTFERGPTDLGRKTVDTGQYPPGTKICATLTVGPPAAYNFAGSRSASACTIVVAEPYFSVNGGDVSTGGGMNSNPAGGSDCATTGNDKAGIVSWNQGASAAYAGAGTQYAALALNHLQDFASGRGSDLVPDGLSFANTADGQVNRSYGMFGGMFGGGQCGADYFNESKAITDNSYFLNAGGITALANGNRKELYIDGNVYINNNVIFTGAGAYANLADIPRFTVVVRGNIFIDPSVSRLDGTYVAQAREDGSGGIIYTCATDGFTVPLLDKNLYGICNQKQLVFNGAVIAKQLWLLRTYGTLTQSSAEQFNYTPEVWLVSPFDDSSASGGDYDAITSLPPIL